MSDDQNLKGQVEKLQKEISDLQKENTELKAQLKYAKELQIAIFEKNIESRPTSQQSSWTSNQPPASGWNWPTNWGSKP